MVSFAELDDFMKSTGFWAGPYRSTHGFLLSPDVYRISPAQAEGLQHLGRALYECLSGLGRIYSIASCELGHGHHWNKISRALATGIPECYRDAQTLNPSRTPAVCKVDLMVEKSTGRFFIAEIDGHNKHGLGYSTLAAALRRLAAPGSASFPGVAKLLAKIIRNRNEGGNRATLLYGNQERFYLPEFVLLSQTLRDKHGIELSVFDEVDHTFPQTPELGGNDGIGLLPELYVDLPFLYRNLVLNASLFAAYRQERADFLIPPKPFMGSKALMAILRNDESDPQLEAILRSQIDSSALQTVRDHLPPTLLVSKQRKPNYWHELCNGDPFVLKGSVSSGMKKVSFPDEPAFRQAFDQACNSYYYFVLQRQIENQPFRFRYFDGAGQLQENDWFLRVTVQYCIREVADVIVTARQDRKVHGAKDCLQLGTIIE